MLFNKFESTAKKYPTKIALNNLTYTELLNKVTSTDYSPVCYATDYTVIIDILVAARLNKSIVILPKFNRDQIAIPKELPPRFNIILYSSGSTGIKKEICLPESMILANALNAVDCQRITCDDVILTVCSLNHTGGINAQTIAGLLSGSTVVIEPFNPFGFIKIVNARKITLTHLIPIMIDSLIKINPSTAIENLRLVVAGSDCVFKHHVEFWNNKGINFMSNYGMSEAGPIVVNHMFKPKEPLVMFDNGVPLGDVKHVDYKIKDGELFLKGPAVNIDGWLATGDCVEEVSGWLYYKGRKSAGCTIIPKKY